MTRAATHPPPLSPDAAKTINGRVLLSDAEAAEALSIDRRTFRRMVETGDLPRPLRFSARCVRWRAADLLRAVENRGAG